MFGSRDMRFSVVGGAHNRTLTALLVIAGVPVDEAALEVAFCTIPVYLQFLFCLSGRISLSSLKSAVIFAVVTLVPPVGFCLPLSRVRLGL